MKITETMERNANARFALAEAEIREKIAQWKQGHILESELILFVVGKINEEQNFYVKRQLACYLQLSEPEQPYMRVF